MIGVEIIAVQHVVLPGVLVLDSQVETAEAPSELIGNGRSEVFATVSITAPFYVDLGQVFLILPVLGVDGI
jgi:hypothetical protein